jgi:predicted AAA+ superfamily ATPase
MKENNRLILQLTRYFNIFTYVLTRYFHNLALQIKRSIKQELIDHLPKKEILLLTGARQVGKTTVLLEIIQDLKNKGEKVLFLNLDNDAHSPFLESQEKLLKKAALELGNSGYIFIDEIQRKENAGIFLKGIYDRNLPYKLIITGSGSLELKEKIHESLSGRKRAFEMMPVTFMEFADYKTNYRYAEELAAFLEMHPSEYATLLNEYLNYGGYPRIVTEAQHKEKLQLIDEIFSSYVEKDIVYLLKIERPEVFKMLIQILASQAAQLINYSSLSTQLGLSVPTLKKYLWYAEKTYSLQRITPYYSNRTKEITKAPVYHFTDIGLRNFAIGVMGNLIDNNQKGFVFQNLVHQLLKAYISGTGWTLHFWRTTDKAEVDFIIDKKNQVLPVEVKFGTIKQLTISRSFRSFIEKYNPVEAWLVNPTTLAETKINNTTVRFLPFYQISQFTP